jgi:hypothetical protein
MERGRLVVCKPVKEAIEEGRELVAAGSQTGVAQG